MRIAQIAPLQVSVPPLNYGGTERVIANMTEGLVRLGHDVTLFATGDSTTSARLVPLVESAFNFDPAINPLPFHLAALAEVYRHAGEFDIIHSHLDYLTLPFAAQCATPTVITLHGPITIPREQRSLRAADPAVHFVSISDSQRAPLPDLNWAATIHHGVDVASFRYYSEPGSYLAFVGRISPEKDPVSAIEIAKMAGIPLKIAAKVDPVDRRYFTECVEPLLDHPLIEFLGPLDERHKRALMGHALALLAPIAWPEPFGMVFIEALASGTPVLARPRGAAREVLLDGVTGFVRESNEALAAAVGELRGLSRARCRRYCEQHFDAMRMARDYARVYHQITAGARERGELAGLRLGRAGRSEEHSVLNLTGV
ncbi:MAG: glycosyltransferase family 4 protein [Ktedonobacterales bacterium]